MFCCYGAAYEMSTCNCAITETFLAQDGATSLCIACQKGNLPVVEQLLVAKADVNHQLKVDPFCTLYCITRNNTIYDTVAFFYAISSSLLHAERLVRKMLSLTAAV